MLLHTCCTFVLQSTAALKECQRDKDVAMADAVKAISQLKLELEHMTSVGLSPCNMYSVHLLLEYETFGPGSGVYEECGRNGVCV